MEQVQGQVRTLPDGRMDAKNAAIYTGLSEKTLAMKRCDGTGPRFVKRGRVFYYREDLDEWLKSARVSSTRQAMKTRGGAVNDAGVAQRLATIAAAEA